VKSRRPRRLEVDRVDQEQDFIRIDLLDQVLDPAIRLFLGPAIDQPGRAAARKIDLPDFCVEMIAHRIGECREHGKSLIVPDRIGDADFNFRVACTQLPQQSTVRFIDLRLGLRIEGERLPHRLERRGGGAVERHAQGHGHAERRQQQIARRLILMDYAQQIEPERRVCLRDILFLHGQRTLRLRRHGIARARGDQ
jgi:hypothetical protein